MRHNEARNAGLRSVIGFSRMATCFPLLPDNIPAAFAGGLVATAAALWCNSRNFR
jgi:hypothetical protein